jgi:phospholipase D1/2
MWRRLAERNTRTYRDVFHCLPDEEVQTWDDYHAFQRAEAVDRGTALSLLAKLQGNVVMFPRRFLSRASLETTSIAPLDVFI